MSEQETAREVDEAAAEWAIRAEAHGAEPETARELQAWLAGDRRREGALLRAEAALSYLNRGRALAEGEPPQPRLLSRRRLIGAGGGLGAMAAGVAGLVMLAPRGERIATTAGEIRKAPLADGSVAAVNTDSIIKVQLKSDLRLIALEKGEGWFKVAKDPSRPFIVQAGEVRVRAVGTAFSVRRRYEGADVLVTEGVVETWTVRHEDRKIRVSAGSKAFVSDEQPPQAVVAAIEIDHALAWRDGQIALYGETLADAAAEFNRYNVRKITIPDPQLASEKVVGQFRTDEPEAFAQAVADTLGARVATDGATIRLYRSAKG